MKYSFNFDTRYYADGKSLVFRRGVWNTIDGVIPFDLIAEKEKFLELLKKLSSLGADEEEVKTLCEEDAKHFEELLQNDFVIAFRETFTPDMLRMLTGQNCPSAVKNSSFLFITDNEYALKECEAFNSLSTFRMRVLPKESVNELSEINLLSRVDSLEYEKRLSHYGEILGEEPILIVLSRASLPLLRNLNKLVHFAQPLFIGMIDGPFLIFLSIIPQQTACFECFEQRMLSSIKDHVLYNRFSSLSFTQDLKASYNLNLTQLLHMGMQEVLMWANFKLSKFMGRALFIYLPTYELHFHELRRISSCKTCGHLSRKESGELHSSLEHLIRDYLREIK